MYAKYLKSIENDARDIILSLAHKNNYQEALAYALPFAIEGYKQIQNDVGVICERLGKYEESKKNKI